MSNLVDFFTSLSFIPDFHNFFFMFIHKAVDKLDSLGFGFTLYNPILNSNCKFTITTFNVDMRWIMVKSIDLNQYALYNKYRSHIVFIIRFSKVSLLFC